jgi:hypothetical protein
MAPDAKTCTASNFENPPDATFCDECGAPQRSELRCDGCGRTSPAGTKFCHGCGCGKRQYQRERPTLNVMSPSACETAGSDSYQRRLFGLHRKKRRPDLHGR